MLKELFLFVLKPLSFAPAVLATYIIFSFSSQTGEVSGNLSYEVSYTTVEVGDHFLQRGLSPEDTAYYAERIEYPVRKLAHMTEYFILAVAVSFPFYVYGLRGFPLMLVAGFLCIGVAGADEYYQSFVGGRGPSIRDVCIDGIGVFVGIIAVRIVCYAALAPARAIARSRSRSKTHRRR